MTQEHPITPPPELVKQWVSLACEYEGDETWIDLATEAARWGADTELDACCSWADATGWYGAGDMLRAARRFKPPSLKKLALTQLDSLHADLKMHGLGTNTDTIRRALEALPE